MNCLDFGPTQKMHPIGGEAHHALVIFQILSKSYFILCFYQQLIASCEAHGALVLRVEDGRGAVGLLEKELLGGDVIN